MIKLEKGNIEDIIALTPMQEGMLFHYLKEPEKDYYFEQLSLKISGKIDMDCFEQAWNFVIETNEMLRTVFRWEKLENPTQVVLKDHTITLRYHDFSTKGIGEKRGRIEEIKAKDRKETFDLREVPFRVTLCKVEEDKFEMIISNHHILYDGWSNGIILREFFNAYNDLTAGKVLFKPAKTSFKEFVKWNQQQDTKKQEIFWREYLRGVDRDNRIEIPIKKGNIKGSENENSKEESGVRNYRYRMTFNGEKKDRVGDFVKAHKITAAALLYGAWGILLQKYANSNDIIFGTTVSGRSAKIKGIENVVGLFINTIPLRVRTSTSTSSGTVCSTGGRQSPVRMLACLSDTLQTREAYENTPLVKINEHIQCSDNEELFDSIVVIENYPLDVRLLQKSGPLSIDSCSIVEATHYDLTVVIQVSDSIDINLIYQDRLFDDVVIRRLGTHFTCIIREILENPWKDISEVDILPPEEKQQILEDFNSTTVDYPRDKTIHQLFEEQAEKTPDNIAVVASSAGYRAHSKGETLWGCPAPERQGRGGGDLKYISYKELNEKSNQLARVLRAEGIGKKGITGIMIHRSVEMVYGVLAILKIGSAYLPVDPDYPQERIHYMLMDSSSNLLLTGNVHTGCLEEGPKIIDIESEEIYNGDTSNLPTVGKADDPAYVIYTSGTTGRPKGVLVEHINVVRLVKNTNYIAFYPHDRLLQTGALEFDASTFEIWGTLLNGAGLVLVSKETILNHGLLKNVIRKCSISIMWLTSSLFNQVSDIELFAGLTHLLVGGDVLSPPHINRVRKRFPHLNVINGYGPTENTTFSTTYLIDDHDSDRESHKKFPIGKPIANSTAYIVDKNNHLMPVGVPGELIVGGDGVSRGYLNNPELTAEKFGQDFQDYQDEKGLKKRTGKYSFTSLPLYPSTSLYRTGDLARWQPDGNIEFLGRMDRQVKVRGFRVELEEIQNVLLKHKDVEEAVVISRNDETGENYLCAYVVGSLGVSQIPGLRDYLSGRLPRYMIPSYFVALDQLPLTPNGKLDRDALPDVETPSGREYRAPRNEREELLVQIWSEVLTIDKDRIGIDDNFFELGGHSLKATGLIGRVHKVFDIEMPLAQLFKSPTIRGLSLYIADMDKSRHSPIEWVEKKEFYMLSSAQKRLFVIHRMNPSNITYNMPGVMKLEGWVERKRLEEAFKKLINRHESLRTSFEIIDDEPIQKIHKAVDFKIEYDKVSNSPTSQFIRPFDLSQPPLMRVGLVETGEDKHILMVDMHHIISDGVSISILIKEFTALYIGKEMPELSLQYKDFSHWQNQRLTSTKIKQQEAYWWEQFEGEIPVLYLPTDYVRPSVQQFDGGKVRFGAGEAETAQLRQLNLATGTTPFMVLLAVFNVMLSKLSSQEDIVVGIPIAGRSHRDLENIIGIFINTLALRNYPSGQNRFSEFLTDVKRNCLEAFENQDYQYEDLVEAVVTNRDLSRNSLFDVMLVLQNMERQQVEIPGLKLIPCDDESPESKFDITLTAVEETKRFEFSMTYSTALFHENTIKRFSNYFKRILTAVLEDTGQGISEIDILSKDEKRELLYGFNTTFQKYPGEKTIQWLFEEQVDVAPDNIAVIGTTYSGSGESSEECPALTYRELNEKSNQLARLLRARGVQSDTISGLMVRPSLEMIIGILAILKAGGAYLPIDPLQPRKRVTYMLNDSQAAVLLTDRHLLGIIDFTGPIIILGDTGVYKGDRRNLKKVSRPANVIYTIYTSGTTGKSKGALIENDNLVNYVYWFRRKSNLTGNDRTLLTSSFGFDLGYTSIFSSILSGCQLHVISRETYLSPEDLTDYIARHRITYIKVTPSLFTTIVESSGFSRESCHTLRLVILGGEEIKLKDVEKAHVIGPYIEIMNHYGPTEATIGCVAQFVDFNAFNDYKKRPTIGYPIDNMKVSILDNGLRMVPTGVPGELCVSGAGVIRGYLNQPELTAEKFKQDFWDYQDDQDEKGKKKRTGKYSFTSLPLYPSTSLYRTGDLARWLSGGVVEFLGRFDSQVKIRGYRIELGEIESRLLTHEAIKEAVVIERKHTAADKYLCAYIVFNRAYQAAIEGPQKVPEIEELREYLAAALPDVMVPSYFVTLEKIPLTPNGKLNRRLLPEPETETIAADYTYTAPRNRVEEKLAELWQEILGPSGERTAIGIDDNFFQRGGHSLKAIMLVSRIHKALNVKMALTEIFKTPTIRGLSAHIKHIKASAEDRYIAIKPVEKKEYYSLSSAQKRLFILHRFDEMGTGYNMPRVVDIEGDLDRHRLEDTFKELIERHESLRTSFEMIEGEPVQKIHESDDVAFEVEYYQSLVNGQWSLVINNFIRSFDLAQAPLLRVGLITGAAGGAAPSILMVDMHHIISDAVSRDLFIRDFMALYSGEVVSDLKIKYKDYSEWQNREKEGDKVKQQEDFWIREFEGEVAVIHLPIDYGRPAVQSFEGKQFRFFLDNEETDALRKLAMEEKATLYMVLMTIYNILLSKISGQEDIVIGLPIVGRRHADLEPVIGMFVNTLALRNYPSREKRFIEFLREVRERTLTGLENQDYQFEDLVDKIAVNRDASRNPLFDVMFVMQDTDIPKMEVPGLKLNPRKYESGISKFDLTFGFEEVKEKLLFCVDYSTKLFAEETIVTFTNYFKKIVSAVLNDNDRDIRIGEIEIISEEERRQLLYDFNDTEAEYPAEKRLHEIFEEQVEKSRDNIAVIFKDIALTRRKLSERTDKLAGVLIEKGVTSGSIAALMVERSLEMVIGIFGILKAGGAYLPIDPNYPEERIKYMLKDSSAGILVSELSKVSGVSEGIEVIDLNQLTHSPTHPISPFQPRVSNIAYVIYTSGSTGSPKGVLIEQDSVLNILFALFKKYPFSERDTYLLKTSYVFDVSVAELFGWFFGGGRLVILERGGEKDPHKILDTIACEGISHINFVPAMFNVFVEILNPGNIDRLSSLKYIFLAGEALLPWLVKKFDQLHSGIVLENIYGPTESTIYASRYSLSEWEGRGNIPIGKPLQNTRLYILDRHDQLQAVGVAGELCISGTGLARGYLNRPELTRGSFGANPFVEGERLYRTGDLARWLADGNIEFLGRMDHQIKVRGFRVELGEIENQLLNHDEVREAVVMAKLDETGDHFLCAYIVPHSFGSFEAHRLRNYLLEKLPDYMIPAHFAVLAEMPLTATGKIDRKSLPAPEITSTKEYIAPRNEKEELLVEIWAEVLAIDKDRIGIDDNFFELGGHSLKATGITTRIHKKFDIEIPLSVLFKAPFIRSLYHYIEKKEKHIHLSIPFVEEKEYYPLSSPQKRFFVFQQIEPDNISYNIPEVMILEGSFLMENIERTFKYLINRHESLRTSFLLVEGEPVQRIHSSEEIIFTAEYYDLTRVKDEVKVKERGEIIRNFVRPFDLICPPLLRFGFVEVEAGKYFIMFDIHHIVSDGVSASIFVKEFLALYDSEELPPLWIQYRDYVNWLKERRQRDTGNRVKMSDETGGEEEVLNIPSDYVRPAVQSFEGKTITFEISQQEEEALISLSLKEGTTLYMVLLSAFNVFLSKLSGQENIVVGSPIAGRLHHDLEGLIGLFINTLVLRSFPSGEKRFSEFLAEVKVNTLQAFESQEYQYEELVEKIIAARDTGRNPLFDVMFVLQNMEMPEIEIPGLKVTRNVGENRTSKFDMTLYCEERDNYVFRLGYSTGLFKSETIQRFIRYFKKVIAEILENPHKKISEIEIISEEEKHQILYDFNDTSVSYPKNKTIYQVFEEQVARFPERIGVRCAHTETGDQEPETGVHRVTYRELNERANQLAWILRSRGLKTNVAAGIMMDRSVEMLVGIFAILKAGGAYLPIDPEYPENRIISMLDNSGAYLLLTNSKVFGAKSLPFLSKQQEQEVLLMDELTEVLQEQPVENLDSISGPGDLIYIIFTSGSTGKPKGAGVYHRGFMNLMFWFVTAFELNEDDRNLLLTSTSFDLTQKNLYASLITGGALCLPAFNYFEPRSLLRGIRDNRVTWINCTPSMFYKLVEYEEVGEEKRLSSLRYVFLGGEPISLSTLINWLESEDCKTEIVNTYGPTECTDICNSYIIKDPRRFLEETIPLGKPVYNVQLYIPDKNLHPLPVGIPGELFIGGEGVGIGYVNDRDLTAQKFIKYSFVAGEPERLLYRTGDLVKWLPDGNIEFLGRIDHQVKVRGFRIELGEIESLLLSHPNVKETVVLAQEGEGGDRYLCAYVVPHAEGTLQVSELREYLAVELPDYMVPAYFVLLENMPLNPNGKVDRKALPEPDLTFGRDYIPPQNEREKVLVNLWSDVLAVDRRQIGIYDNFFQLGGHSLKAAGLVGRIHKAFSVEIPLAELFKIPTVKGISDYIEKTKESIYSSLKPVEEKEYYTLSSAQKRLFVIHQMGPIHINITYNLPAVMILEGELEKARLEKTFGKLINRYESLRTSFEIIDEEPVQKIHNEVNFKIEYDEVSNSLSSYRQFLPLISQFIHPFDLSQVPLLRVGLIKIEVEKHLLMVDMHHIISDGVSMGVFTKEFMTFYKDKSLPGLRLQYKDFSHWQNSLLASAEMKKQETYWQKQFEGEIPVLNLPSDYMRPSVQQFEGDRINFEIEEEMERLNQLALETGSTLYMVLFAVFNLFLSKLSSQEDIVVGTPIAGRRHPDLGNIIGMFVNTLAVRTDISGQKTFQDFLTEVKENLLRAFENQDYQYEELVETVVTNRDLSRNPLFDVVFVLQNMETEELEIPGLQIIPWEYENKTSKFDLTLQCIEVEKNLQFGFEYSTKLFKEAAIRRFINYFKRIISGILENPEIELSDIEIISEKEKKQVVVDFNQTSKNYPKYKTLHQLFEEQVLRTPHRTALTQPDIGHFMSYMELNESAIRLAWQLKRKGVGPESIVGLLASRSFDMIVGILAILKAGGAYLPIDPQYPEERVAYMLKEASVQLVLLQESNSNRVEGVHARVLISSTGLTKGETGNPEGCASFDSTAYVMYTSGTTGKPKGTMVSHFNAIRIVKETNYIEIDEDDRLLQVSNYAFDGSIFDIFGALLNGAVLVLMPKDEIFAVDKLVNLLKKGNITVFFLTTALFNTLVDIDIDCLKDVEKILFGGEQISVSHTAKALEYLGKGRLLHMYGPTETTVYATCYDLDHVDENRYTISIGSPISNTVIYILDGDLKPLPIGVRGEIYIGGDGVTRGYLNRLELTQEKFVESPFVEGERLYKTGDLASWLPDGDIEFSGRIDHQTKIRGFRIEVGEIENYLLAHEDIKETIVIPKSNEGGDKYLCAYIVSDSEVSVPGLRDYLSSQLPDYMIPSYFTFLEKIPLNPNGKIDRKALPAPEARITEAYVAPRNEVEGKLAEIWSSVLGVEKEIIGIDSNFFELGGHSLKAINVGNKIHKTFEVAVTIQDLFKHPTIAGTSRLIQNSKIIRFREIEKLPEQKYYELSYSQKRLWYICKLEPHNTSFSMPGKVTLYEVVDETETIVRKVLEQLTAKHESLRTYFKEIGKEPVQVIEPVGNLNLNFEIEDWRQLNEAELGSRRNQLLMEESSFIFNLEEAPLFRTKLVKCKEKEYELVFNMHHIISDGWSLEILKQEFNQLYEAHKKGIASDLEPLKLQYKDYAAWQNQLLTDEEQVGKAKEFWENQLSGNLPVLNLPYDFSRPSGSKESAGYRWVIPGDLTARLRVLAGEQGASLFMLLLAGFKILLSQITVQKDIMIAIPAAARQHEALRNIIGMFVNTLILRNHINHDGSFIDFFKQLQDNTFKALEYQSIPLELICGHLKIKYPEVSVFFNMVNIGSTLLENVTDQKSYHLEKVQEAKFDIVCYLMEYKNGIEINCHYFKNRFKPITIEKLMDLYMKVLDNISIDPAKKIGEYSLSYKKRKLKRHR